MSELIAIYGASDDLVEVEGCKGADEWSSDFPLRSPWRGDLVAPNGERMRLTVFYDGCWHVGLGQTEGDTEAEQFPEWPIKFRQERHFSGGPGYSVRVTIEAPDGTELTNVSAGDAA